MLYSTIYRKLKQDLKHINDLNILYYIYTIGADIIKSQDFLFVNDYAVYKLLKTFGLYLF